MKLRYIAMVATGLTLMASCTDNDYAEFDKGNTELAINASATELTLNEVEHATDALELTWTSGTNHGTGNRISYTLELAIAGTEFAEPAIIKSNVLQEYSWKPNVETLNAIVLNDLHCPAGVPATIEARITATVANMEETQVATTEFVVTPYTPVTPTLFIIGDATPNGWSVDAATEMTRTDNGIFTWTGDLAAGELKFITTKGQFLPSYGVDAAGKFVLRTSDDQPDGKIVITEAHCYKVDVNLLTLTVTLTETEGVVPPYDAIFFVGNETDWNFVPMYQDPLDPFIFKLGYEFVKGGDFKFGTAPGSWENMYKAAEESAPYTNTGVSFISGFDPDPKWVLNADELGAYRMNLDIRVGAERMLMCPFPAFEGVYLVGSATPNGWDLGNATPMTVDSASPYIFTWSGNLSAGELKFSTDKKDDWMGGWYLAPTEGAEPAGVAETAIYINKSDDWYKDMYPELSVGDIDRKWNITEAGAYTITLNTLTDQITIRKQ